MVGFELIITSLSRRHPPTTSHTDWLPPSLPLELPSPYPSSSLSPPRPFPAGATIGGLDSGGAAAVRLATSLRTASAGSATASVHAVASAPSRPRIGSASLGPGVALPAAFLPPGERSTELDRLRADYIALDALRMAELAELHSRASDRVAALEAELRVAREAVDVAAPPQQAQHRPPDPSGERAALLGEIERLQGEGRLLRRAVTIQNSRSLALAGKVAELEETVRGLTSLNYALRAHVATTVGGGGAGDMGRPGAGNWGV